MPSTSSPPATTTSPAASPVVQESLPLGIVVKDFLIDGGPTYSVSLIGLDGRVVATATAAKRNNAHTLVQMPNISASNSRLYYLDGESKVMFLRPDGTTGLSTTLTVDAGSSAVFAVSPDDKRIAVAILTFPYPAKTRIYVEDLAGGGNHVELFSSTTVIEWPVGWHDGHLVIAAGINAQPQNAWDGFVYGVDGYHVADAATGVRLATVCGGGYEASQPPVPAGTVCVRYPNYEVSDWTGATRPAPHDAGCGGGALSPDGSLIADCQGNPRMATLVARDGSTKPTSFPADQLGWIDSNHVVVQQTWDSSIGILDIRTMTLTPAQAHGFYAGAIPGTL
ncbi:MAG TPA: hypothetical protein VHO95_11325 [Candidatus Dormibacteraeota bacterium]|nr:hypothetical protein [Candidatus Dormibacteraeota bacterium]HEX2680773.1 hypothetical protein [Candidatus Dormibacteraeota bacterium]